MESIVLTQREKSIIEYLLRGYSNQEIATELHIKTRTVKAHLNKLFLKFRINDGLKRIKLAVMLYSRPPCMNSMTNMERGSLQIKNIG